jgi:hypothetical protein
MYSLFLAWAIGGTLLSILLAPFTRRTSNANVGPLVIAGIAGGLTAIKGVSGILKNKSADEAKKAEMLMYNEWLKDRSQTADDIAAKLAERGVDIYGPQISTTTQQGGGTSQSFTRGTQDSTTSNRPIITEEYQPMEQQLRSLIEGRLGKGQFSNEELVSRTLANRVRAVNRASAGAEQSVLNKVGRQGGGALKLAGGLAPLAASRAGQIADIAGNIPMEARGLENEDLARAQGAIGAFGRGDLSRTRGTTTSSTTGSNTYSGGSTSTAPPNFSALFNTFAAPSPTSSGKTGYNLGADIGGTSADLGFQLLKLFGGKGAGGAGTPPGA